MASLWQFADNYPTPARIVATIAVSKRQVVDSIQQAYKAGARNFAESFLQEALPKIEQLAGFKDIVWHFIGPIQSNKTRQIAAHFDWVQSVCRDKIAQRLSLYRTVDQAPLNVLIQVNISAETSKSGVLPEQVIELAKLIQSLPQLTLRGLMCIPAKTTNVDQQMATFQRMFNLFEASQKQFPQMDTLSMGMSNDYLTAIQSGATMVRIGSALFGSRTIPVTPDE